MFGGLNVKFTSAKSDTKEQAQNGKPKEEDDTPPAPAAASMFDFMKSTFSGTPAKTPPPSEPATQASTISQPPGPSAFSFMQPVSDSGAEQTGDFITESTPPTAPVSSFSFLSAAPPSAGSRPAYDTSLEPSNSSSAAILAAQQKDDDLLAPHAIIRPANIKKKRGSRLPGFARRDGSSMDSHSEADSRHTEDQRLGDFAEMDMIPSSKDSHHEEVETTVQEPIEEAKVESGVERKEIRLKEEGELDDSIEASTQAGAEQQGRDEGDDDSQEHIEKEEKDSKLVLQEKESIHFAENHDHEEPSKKNEPDQVTVPKSKSANPPPKAVVEKKTDVEGELSELLQAFQRSASQFAQGLKKVDTDIQRKNEAIQRNELEAESLADRIKSFESEQNAALEAEDFEKADRLQRTIDAVGRSVGEVDSRRIVLNRELEELESQKTHIYDDQLKSIDLIAELLADCSQKEKERAHTFDAETKKSIEDENDRLDEEEDLLRIELEGIQTDIQVVDRELNQINAKVDAGTVDLRSQREEWEGKISEVDEGIAELQRLLEEKLQMRATLQASLDQVNNGIQSVRSKYDSRLHELETRRENVDQKRIACESRNEEILAARVFLEERQKCATESAKEIERASDEIVSQLDILQLVAARLKSNEMSEHKKEGDGNGSSVLSQLKKLSDQIDVNNQSINFSSRQVSEMENGMVEETSKLYDIDSKLPALNEQKKLAVSTRNFKEAGRVAALIKDLSTEKSQLEETLVEKKAKLEELNDTIAQRQQENEDLQKKRLELKDGMNESLLESLQLKRVELRTLIYQVSTSGSVDPRSLGSIILDIVGAEMSACEEQAKRISIQICGDESLAILPEMQAVEEETPAETELASSPPALDDADSNSKSPEASPSSEPKCSQQNISSSPPLSSSERAEILSRIEKLEAGVATAVENDDFESAEVLDGELQGLRAQLANSSAIDEEDEESELRKAIEEDNGEINSASIAADVQVDDLDEYLDGESNLDSQIPIEQIEVEDHVDDENDQNVDELDDDDKVDANDQEENPTQTEATHMDAVILAEDSDSDLAEDEVMNEESTF